MKENGFGLIAQLAGEQSRGSDIIEGRADGKRFVV